METRVKRYKPYRKQINKEFILLQKTNKTNNELEKIIKKLSKIDKSLIKIEEIDLFGGDVVYDDEWMNYLISLKAKISYYDINEISKIFISTQLPITEINPAPENYSDLINSFVKEDEFYGEIVSLKQKINSNIKCQEKYKRELKDIDNYIDKVLIECKKIRINEPYIKNIRRLNDDKKNSKLFKFSLIFIIILFSCFLIVGIIFMILGGFFNEI